MEVIALRFSISSLSEPPSLFEVQITEAKGTLV
jgi:hypothetical protein